MSDQRRVTIARESHASTRPEFSRKAFVVDPTHAPWYKTSRNDFSHTARSAPLACALVVVSIFVLAGLFARTRTG